MSEWLPIETAPKDGTSVIVAVRSLHKPDQWIVGEANFHPDDWGGGWWWANNGPGDYYASSLMDGNGGNPSFWQPLPEPPSSSMTITSSRQPDTGGVG